MLIVFIVSMPNWLWQLLCPFSTSPLLYVLANQAIGTLLFHVCALGRCYYTPLCWHNSWEFSSAELSKKINAKIEGWTNTDKARKWPCSMSLTKQRWLMSATGGYAASHSSEVLSRPSDPGRTFFLVQAQMSLLVPRACWQQHSSSPFECIEKTSELTFVWGWTWESSASLF